MEEKGAWRRAAAAATAWTCGRRHSPAVSLRCRAHAPFRAHHDRIALAAMQPTCVREWWCVGANGARARAGAARCLDVFVIARETASPSHIRRPPTSFVLSPSPLLALRGFPDPTTRPLPNRHELLLHAPSPPHPTPPLTLVRLHTRTQAGKCSVGLTHTAIQSTLLCPLDHMFHTLTHTTQGTAPFLQTELYEHRPCSLCLAQP